MRFSPPVDLSPFSAFIFDCDGTLADTMVIHYEAWKRALGEAGAQFVFTWELFLSRAGMSMEGTVRELGQQFAQEFDEYHVAARQREHFAELEHEVAGIEEVLHFARAVSREFPTAVASGSSKSSVIRTLRRIHVEHLFDVVVTPEDVERGKPFPDMFLLAAQHMRVAPERCLVIEDGVLGIEAARRAGMQCAIVQTVTPREALPSES